MPTSLSFDQDFPADVATVLAMLRDPEYVRHKAERTGGRDVTVVVEAAEGDGVVLVCTRLLPAEVPSFARSIVGDTVTVTERHEWGPTDAQGLAAARATVAFSAPVAYEGRIDLVAGERGTIVRNHGSFRASVPLVGGKIERLVAEQTQRYLTKEIEIGAAWLTGQ